MHRDKTMGPHANKRFDPHHRGHPRRGGGARGAQDIPPQDATCDGGINSRSGVLGATVVLAREIVRFSNADFTPSSTAAH